MAALAKLGAFVTQISGKIGGSQFASSPSGTYIKNIGTRSKFVTGSQAKKLTKFANTVGLWRELSNANKTAWNEASVNFPYVNRIGETKTYSGYNLFVKFNGSLKAVNEPIFLTSPAPYSFDPISETGVSITPTSFFLTFSETDPNCLYIIKMFVFQSRGSFNTSKKTIQIGFVPPSSLDGLTNLISLVNDTFGSVTTNQAVIVEVDAVYTGSGQRLNNVMRRRRLVT